VLAPLNWRRPVALFVATVFSIGLTGGLAFPSDGRFSLANGVTFAVALLSILLTHEFGHFLFARYHGVNASLPFFIPLPLVSPFGTMGAVILMRDRIKSRNALLDIGASGPLAGLAVAIPVLVYGLAHSEVRPIVEGVGTQEGQSLLYMLLKRVTVGPIPEGSDVWLHPMAFAGWAGLLVTMLNLLPVGQLDGGHVAYALFGPRQNGYSKIVRYSLLALVPINFAWHLFPALGGAPYQALLWSAFQASVPWVVWFIVLTALDQMSGGGHPPTEPGTLSPSRRIIAIGTLLLFVLLFMPTPMTSN
jgi:membrane-associated protease RseP (regulator of RpoE activity)